MGPGKLSLDTGALQRLACSISTISRRLPLLTSPASDHIEDRISLDELFISHPSATYFVKAANTYWRAGISQGALLIVDCSATPCDGSVVVCKLAGEFHIRRFRTPPYKYLESLGDDGVRVE